MSGGKIRDARKAKGVTLEALAEAGEISTGYLSRIERGERSASLETRLKMAAFLGVPPEDLSDEPLPAGAKEFVPASVRIPHMAEMPKDLPVLGTAAGAMLGQGFEGFDFFGQGPIDYVRRPPGLAHAREAYGLYVVNDSMIPMHPPGELRIVNPLLPVRVGDSVIVQTKHWEEDPGQGYIKVLKQRRPDWIVLEQLNPVATIEIPTKYVVSIHRVLTLNELFGV